MVRHRSLDPAFAGSNPSAPAISQIGMRLCIRTKPLFYLDDKLQFVKYQNTDDCNKLKFVVRI